MRCHVVRMDEDLNMKMEEDIQRIQKINFSDNREKKEDLEAYGEMRSKRILKSLVYTTGLMEAIKL